AARPPRERPSMLRRAPPHARPRQTRAARRPRPSGFPASRESGGRGRWRCDSFVLLGEIEVVVLALERKRAPIFAVLACEQLGCFDARPKALRRAPQLELRVDVELARHVDRGKEDIAELFGPALLRAEILLQLAQLVLEIGERTVDVGILEADRLRTLLDLPCMQ